MAPLLVFYHPQEASPEAGDSITVTGMIHEVFNPSVVEEDVGGDPGPNELAYYHGQIFLRAENVVVAEPEGAAPRNLCPRLQRRPHGKWPVAGHM